MTYALSQAAAEYVGVMISNGIRTVGIAGRDFANFLGDNPIAVIAMVLVLILLWKLISRR
jgi:hypothetical protein